MSENLGVAAWDEDQTPCSLDCSQIRYCPGHQAPIGLKEVLIFVFDITNSRYIQKSLAKNITQQKKREYGQQHWPTFSSSLNISDEVAPNSNITSKIESMRYEIESKNVLDTGFECNSDQRESLVVFKNLDLPNPKGKRRQINSWFLLTPSRQETFKF